MAGRGLRILELSFGVCGVLIIYGDIILSLIEPNPKLEFEALLFGMGLVVFALLLLVFEGLRPNLHYEKKAFDHSKEDNGPSKNIVEFVLKGKLVVRGGDQ